MTGPDRMAYHEESGGKRSWFQRVCLLQSGGTPNGATETAALLCVLHALMTGMLLDGSALSQ